MMFALAGWTMTILNGSTLRAQTPEAETSGEGRASSEIVFLAWQGNPAVQRCGLCHFSPGNSFAERSTDFCRLDELQQWLKRDKHAIARQRVEPIAADRRSKEYDRIKNSLAVRARDITIPKDWIGESNYLSDAICKQLGYDVQSPEGYDEYRKNCLTCHAGYDARLPSSNSFQSSESHPGIGCVYCHQNDAGEKWIDEHSSLDVQFKWRSKPAAEKAAAGMRDLASVGVQAELCFGCHIGDPKRNMFVTHEMFAAGHPQLPNVEFSSFVEAMPRHWRGPDELFQSLGDRPDREAYFRSNYPGLAERIEPVDTKGHASQIDQLPWQIHSMAVGGLAAQQHWLRMVRENTTSTSGYWGNYAMYDCAACHHELRNPSRRQSFRAPGAPGRPRLLEWPRALARAVAVAAGSGELINGLEDELNQAVTKQPFGQPEQVGRQAGRLIIAIEELMRHTQSEALSEAFALRLLEALVQTPDELLIDYHSSRQVVLALRCIDTDLQKLGRPLSTEIHSSIEKLNRGPDPNSVRISIDLPGGQSQAIFPTFLKDELDRQAAYDPEQFRQLLRGLSALVLKNQSDISSSR